MQFCFNVNIGYTIMNVDDKWIFKSAYEYLLKETETLQCCIRNAFVKTEHRH